MKVNRRLLGGMVAAVIGVCMVTGVHATSIVLDYGSVHSGNGGEFVVKSDGTADSTAFVNSIVANYSSLATYQGGFETFCIEYNEHFSPGGVYNVQVNPNGQALKGGLTVGDYVSVGSAYLYSLFAQGALTGYDYNSSASAGNLQNTIWFLESEQMGLPSGPFIANPGTFNSLLIAEFGNNPAAWIADSATSLTLRSAVTAASYGVTALNMGPSPTFPNQDQLVYLGGGRQDVPDGGTTLMLLGVAVGGMSLLRRKLA